MARLCVYVCMCVCAGDSPTDHGRDGVLGGAGALRRAREYKELSEDVERAVQYVERRSHGLRLASVFARDLAAVVFPENTNVRAALLV
jgi:hypothetical protein